MPSSSTSIWPVASSWSLRGEPGPVGEAVLDLKGEAVFDLAGEPFFARPGEPGAGGLFGVPVMSNGGQGFWGSVPKLAPRGSTFE